ncbi:MAG: lipocalin-like domain-containing protein [Steroidobacterales bacterium]
MKRRRFLASPVLLLATDLLAAEEYPRVLPGRPFQFPRDGGAHPAFRSEWWYVTGWVHDARGNNFGIQITFFRNRPRVAEANPSMFAPRQLLFAHAAIADPRFGKLRHDQRAARAGFGLAEAMEETTDVWIGDWSLRLMGDRYTARIAARDFQLDLLFSPTQAVLPQGIQGFSRKGPSLANASYYYSQPQLTVSGSVSTDDKRIHVAGIAWLDHEWSSEPLATEASGWDWTGIDLNDGSALMAFRIRDHAGAALWAAGSLRASDGRLRNFEPSEIRFSPRRRWQSPRTGVEYPIAMTVAVGDTDYILEPLIDDQELDTRGTTGTLYWEGAVRALLAEHEVGRGYLELTGYGQPLKF